MYRQHRPYHPETYKRTGLPPCSNNSSAASRTFEDVFELSGLQAGGERLLDGNQVFVEFGDVEIGIQIVDGAEVIALLGHRKQVIEAMNANLQSKDGWMYYRFDAA